MADNIAEHSNSNSESNSGNGRAAAAQSPDNGDGAAAAALLAELRRCGISFRASQELVEANTDGWLSKERVLACFAAVQAREGVKNRAALLLHKLQARDEDPPPPPDPEDRYRYITGKYAHIVQH